MSGKLFAIEGLDGSGKGTQTQLLYEALAARGLPVRKVSFPRYDSAASAPVRMYLEGRFGSRPQDVNAYAASAFFAVDRFAAWREELQPFYEGGGILLADRYTTANAVHQCSKLPAAQWDGFLDWLFDFEYQKIGLPAPDKVLFLDMSPQVSQQLLSGRYHGQEAARDIHERDLAYLQRSREAAQYCAKKLGWQRVVCDAQGAPRPVQEIHAEVLAAVLQALQA